MGDSPSSESELRPKKGALHCHILSALDFVGLVYDVLQGLMMQSFPNTGFYMCVWVFFLRKMDGCTQLGDTCLRETGPPLPSNLFKADFITIFPAFFSCLAVD